MIPFISQAHAAAEGGAAAAAAGPGMIGQLVMLGGFVLIFWLLIWRPQSKRAKEHKNLIAGLAKGDEVVTTGGILGKVSNVTDEFVTLQVADNMELNFQKGSVAATLPKGTIKAIK
ncbi:MULTISPECIES: preprotein translocase subunit YajC [Gammaproteobacteria]|uniref:preprotein translocase subunit YajC n=1 Tax=Gammaproteobacteria TaxID=1236 RepID=UPI000C777A7D|nr:MULTISPECIES: preprotein translocase subunit YajC [Gammaproteobacteria]MBO9479805.1 preprotein translocase subunit YajC [Salinisphaera sp. G21_0]MBO9492697.1 preprotein translocase subunit YajC [Thalassotalea sp. G20_0]WBA86539.1 preprotein translocase subunit YajC [Endozoicomonas sp. GU-1]